MSDASDKVETQLQQELIAYDTQLANLTSQRDQLNASIAELQRQRDDTQNVLEHNQAYP
jgi:hypothetical protein